MSASVSQGIYSLTIQQYTLKHVYKQKKKKKLNIYIDNFLFVVKFNFDMNFIHH